MDDATAAFLDSVSASLRRIPRYVTPFRVHRERWSPLVDSSEVLERWLDLDPQLQETTSELIEAIGTLCGRVTRNALLARQLYALLARRCGDHERAATLYGVKPEDVLLEISAELQAFDAADEAETPDELKNTGPWLRLVRDPPEDEQPLPDEPAADDDDRLLGDDGKPPGDSPPHIDQGQEWQLDHPRMADMDDEPTSARRLACWTPESPVGNRAPDQHSPRDRTRLAVAACIAIAGVVVAVALSSDDAGYVDSRAAQPSTVPPAVAVEVLRQPSVPTAEPAIAPTTAPAIQPVAAPEAPGAAPDAETATDAGAAETAQRAPPAVNEEPDLPAVTRREYAGTGRARAAQAAPAQPTHEDEEASTEIMIISRTAELAPIAVPGALVISQPHRSSLRVSIERVPAYGAVPLRGGKSRMVTTKVNLSSEQAYTVRAPVQGSQVSLVIETEP